MEIGDTVKVVSKRLNSKLFGLTGEIVEKAMYSFDEVVIVKFRVGNCYELHVMGECDLKVYGNRKNSKNELTDYDARAYFILNTAIEAIRAYDDDEQEAE
jgi:hypothetical protein